jgi:hypothetical protein
MVVYGLNFRVVIQLGVFLCIFESCRVISKQGKIWSEKSLE